MSPSSDVQRRTSPLVIGAVGLAIAVPAAFGAWLVFRPGETTGAAQPESALPMKRLFQPRVQAWPRGPRVTGLQARPMLTAPQPAAPGAQTSDEAELAAIDHQARAAAAAQLGLTADEAARVEAIRKEADRTRGEVAKHEWVSDEDATALHDSGKVERQGVADSIGEARAQSLRSAERFNYSRILREGNFANRPVLRGQLMMRQLNVNTNKLMGPAPGEAPPQP